MALKDNLTWAEICEQTISKLSRSLKKSEVTTFRKWFMYRKKVGYLFDYILILRCFRIWQELKQGLDHFICISGREGLGKTTLAFQVASWVNPDGFNLENVCYGSKKYVEILQRKANETYSDTKQKLDLKSESIVLDEGTELLSRESFNLTNRILTKSFFVQRALNFLVICNIPNYFMIDSVIRLHRVRTLIHVTARGKYKCMTGKGITKINKEGAVLKDINSVKLFEGVWWTGYFNKEMPGGINWTQYELYKMESIKELLQEMREDASQRKMIAASRAAKEIGCKPDTIITMIKKQTAEGKQIGARWYLTKKAYDKLMTA